jgi:hypothetical protein
MGEPTASPEFPSNDGERLGQVKPFRDAPSHINAKP